VHSRIEKCEKRVVPGFAMERVERNGCEEGAGNGLPMLSRTRPTSHWTPAPWSSLKWPPNAKTRNPTIRENASQARKPRLKPPHRVAKKDRT
jgi:hypothetical protein